VWLFFLPARLRAHRAPGIPCALCLEGKTFSSKPRAASSRENAESYLDVIASEAKQSSFLRESKPDCFVASLLANDGFKSRNIPNCHRPA
jgi:hypothetical protein